MAAYQIPTPTPMSPKGDVTENWKDFEDSWSHYVTATGLRSKLTTEDGVTANPEGCELVASTLCSVMGAECKKVMNSLPALSAADKKDPKKILDALRNHYVPQRNVLYERFVFNSTTQRPNETTDEFVVRLRQLADSCEYGTLRESLIRDRIVIGTSDDDSRGRILRERPVPDLTKVIDILRTAEISRPQKQAMSGKPDASVNYTDRSKKLNRKLTKQTPHKQTQSSYINSKRIPAAGAMHDKIRGPHQKQQKASQCKWCGHVADHAKKDCPARASKCHKCAKMGHYSAVCRSTNRVQAIDIVDGDGYETLNQYLGEVIAVNDNFWSVNLCVNNHNTDFKLDSGSRVTVINDKIQWIQNVQLQPVKSSFSGPGGVTLSHLMIGEIPNARLCLGEKEHRETVYVMKGQKHNLLSKAAIQALELLTPSPEVYSVEATPDYKAEFPELFKGLGKLKDVYRIPLRQDAVPVCIYTPGRVPHPLLPRVKEKLKLMQESDVISPVSEPTEWCSGLVVAPKPNGDIRICVDLTNLNKAVRREIHPMANVDDNLAKLRGSRVFTKLDANSSFWQMPLDKESRLLTTFVTPFGRFCFNRLPFGISSAPEIFQRTMSTILTGLEGVVCHMDDVLIHAKDQQTHDSQLRKVLSRLRDAGLTLNEKCQFSKPEMKFLGHIVSERGVEADPEKTNAIRNFPRPTCVSELMRFNGMVNQLAKFLPGLSECNEPLRQLLKKDSAWLWDQPQERAFNAIKEKLISTEVLAHYDVQKHSVIAADASQSGLGAVLLQSDEDGNRRPIAFASRSLSDTEKRYAVIEKEALAAQWACEKFSDYIMGAQFTLETDHRPLVPLLSSKDLSKLPARILRFRMKIDKYSPEVRYVQGKHQTTADALSRAPTSDPTLEDIKLIEEMDEESDAVLKFIPASEKRLKEIRDAQDADAVCKQVKAYCLNGWPSIMPQQPLIRPYWEKREHLTVNSNILMYDRRLVIPSSLQLEILDAIHVGHLGISKCQNLASDSVWWPCITKQIEAMVNKCPTCAKLRPARKEPLLATQYPKETPWSYVATDLFELDKKHYMIVVDYTSRWFEFKELEVTTSQAVIKTLCEVFSVHGIPEVVMSDNGPQYSSREFQAFAKDWGFTHVTSSPMHPQANGEAERAVQTAKNILRKNANPYLGLLAYRTAKLQNGHSPSELLMGRRLRSKLPCTPEMLVPTQVDKEKVAIKEEEYRKKYSKDYDRRHQAKLLPFLQEGDKVYIRDQDRYGEITKHMISPRSYQVRTETGTSIVRNRSALVHTGQQNVQDKQHTNDRISREIPPAVSPHQQGLSPFGPVSRTKHLMNPPNTPVKSPNIGDPPDPVQVTRSGRIVKPNKQTDMEYY